MRDWKIEEVVAGVGDRVPRRDRGPLSAFGKRALRAAGWRADRLLPNVSRCVAVFAPHTSNWDFVVGIALIAALRIQATWIGKHTIFRKPFAGIFRWLGGIPIDRRSPQGMIRQMIDTFESKDAFFLVMAPEGTRSRVKTWKSGFYWIALEAGVPILPVSLDYPYRMIRFGPLLEPSGDYDADLAALQSYFAGSRGKRS